MKEDRILETCGHCSYFKEHNSKTGYANGYWLGDGKCIYKKVTVVGDTCEHFQPMKKIIIEEISDMLKCGDEAIVRVRKLLTPENLRKRDFKVLERIKVKVLNEEDSMKEYELDYIVKRLEDKWFGATFSSRGLRYVLYGFGYSVWEILDYIKPLIRKIKKSKCISLS